MADKIEEMYYDVRDMKKEIEYLKRTLEDIKFIAKDVQQKIDLMERSMNR